MVRNKLQCSKLCVSLLFELAANRKIIYGRTLICIPVGGQILSAAGTTVFVCFFGGILVVALASFTMARWACLEYRWVWKAKI
jgi:hypothetical protein